MNITHDVDPDSYFGMRRLRPENQAELKAGLATQLQSLVKFTRSYAQVAEELFHAASVGTNTEIDNSKKAVGF